MNENARVVNPDGDGAACAARAEGVPEFDPAALRATSMNENESPAEAPPATTPDERSAPRAGRGAARLVDRLKRTARTWAINTRNAAIYLFSGGRQTRHEGRYDLWRGTWTNWSRTFEAQPQRFATPETEEEICALVRASSKVRVVAGGHSFNASPLTSGTMLSLEHYDRILSVDLASRVVCVQAGVRLRDLTAHLQTLGLAFPVLGSTNAQSIGGLVATDLHGTGRDHGFLSEQILSLRIVDADGVARTFRRGSDVFHAAIGGLGTCGIVTEVEVQCVPSYNLEKSLQIVPRRWVQASIDRILTENDHVSFYYAGGVDVANVRMNLWNRTEKAPERWLGARKVTYELLDMLISGYLLGVSKLLDMANAFATLGLLFFKATMHGRITVYPSAPGFARKLFYHHDELEYGVPYETHRDCLDEILAMLRRRRFLSIVEVRFTPDTSSALLGPGVGRRTCFIELAPSLSLDSTEVFAEAEAIFARYGGQPHLGKKTSATSADMAALYQERWTMFCEARRQQDPGGKFLNDFGSLFQVEEDAPARTSAAA
jgi:FAD/FMN-containing dehydrogenase